MAKSRRASSVKANNQKLKKNVFGPIEAARAERLSAKLLEVASQPKPRPIPEEEMADVQDEEGVMDVEKEESAAAEIKTDETAMEIDQAKPSAATGKKSHRVNRRKIEKKRRSKSSTVFASFRDRQLKKRKKKN